MKTDKWLYFRTVSAVSDDAGIISSVDYNPTSICIPASSIVNMYPTSDTGLRIGITPMKHQGGDDQYTVSGYHSVDYVDLTLGANNKHKEVMAAINSAATNSRTLFIVIADDVAGEYLDSNISACSTMTAYRFPPGDGVHEYYEILSTSTSADADGEVCGELDMRIPPEAVLLEAALQVRALGSHANGKVRLDFHSATTANGAAAAGTEWVGAAAKAGGSGEVAKPVYTITFAGALVASNTFNMNVNGTALSWGTNNTFDTNSNTSIGQIATALAALGSITTAAVTDAGGGTDDDRVITVTGEVKGVEVNMDGLTVAAGASQTTAALAQTTNSWSGLSSMPPADLDAGSGATINSVVHSGTASPIYRGTNGTWLQLVACEDLSNSTTIIGVYVKWFGRGGRLA